MNVLVVEDNEIHPRFVGETQTGSTRCPTGGVVVGQNIEIATLDVGRRSSEPA